MYLFISLGILDILEYDSINVLAFIPQQQTTTEIGIDLLTANNPTKQSDKLLLGHII